MNGPALLFLCVLGGVFGDTRRQLSIRVVTWNTGYAPPGQTDLDPLLGVWPGTDTDLIVIGAWECSDHNLTPYRFDRLQEVDNKSAWQNLIENRLARAGFAKLAEQYLGAIVELVYVKAELVESIANVMTSFKGTGLFGFWRNKGGVSVRFDYGGRSFVFVNSHLAAGQRKVQDKIEDYQQILRKSYFSHPKTPYILDHDYVFWLGDLNFRVEGLTKYVVEKMIPVDLTELRQHDQLLRAMRAEMVFNSFQEFDVKFQPTYKYDKGTSRYDTSAKQRVPSWTDRILYRTQPGKQGLEVIKARYKSYMTYFISDHKPVTLSCRVTL